MFDLFQNSIRCTSSWCILIPNSNFTLKLLLDSGKIPHVSLSRQHETKFSVARTFIQPEQFEN
jgi:hypothetical protein